MAEASIVSGPPMADNPVMRVTVAVVSLLLAACGSRSSTAPSQPKPILTQYEKQHLAGWKDPSCRQLLGVRFSTSKVTVFDNRDVQYELSEHSYCLGQGPVPGSEGKKSVFRYVLTRADFDQLRRFLDRSDIKGVQWFLSAGGGVGDFEISIARPTGTQVIKTTGLMPSHPELVEHPSLVHLVCRGKEMARVASKSGETPDWCRNLKPL